MAKALALDVVRWQEIEVVGAGGAPAIRLHGATAAAAPGEVRVSLTHTDRTAGAVALVG